MTKYETCVERRLIVTRILGTDVGIVRSQVVRNQEAFVEDESMGPLAEIDFWRKRNLNLGGIRDQIRHHVHMLYDFLQSSLNIRS